MYKEFSFDNGCVLRIADNANVPKDSTEYLAWLAEGNTPEPADPIPNPRISEIKAELASIDQKSIRAIREGDTVRIAEWEAQAQSLRAELAGL